MKHLISAIALLLTLVCLLTACTSDRTLLDPRHPVTLTMWHVYGEQADSPMNRLVDEFNATLGREQGVVINVTLMTNSTDIGPRLLAAQKGIAGSGELPDLFSCHTGNAAQLGTEHLLDWNEFFSPEERASFVDSFLEEGTIDGCLSVLPVSKSTHILFVNGALFQRFSQDTGISLQELSTWDGFFRVAQAYYDWSGGMPFCALDFLLRAMELSAISQGTPVSLENGWYDLDDPALKKAWEPFAQALVQGHILVSDLYSNTQVMTGEVAAGLGSCAAILYYNDTVTYEDSTSEPMQLITLPMPHAPGGQLVTTQAGVGLCACRTTDAKAEAASLFAHWLTEPQRNLEFVADSGYMPVNHQAFEAIASYPFADKNYAAVYQTLRQLGDSYTAYTEPAFPGYYDRVDTLYAAIRAHQRDWAARYRSGEPLEILTWELWDIFSTV